MVRRKRPGHHQRRVHTKRGIRTKTINPGIPLATKKQIIKDNYSDLRTELKRKGRVSIPDLGVLRVNVRPAKKARMGRNPFSGEQMMFKAKPRCKVVKFRSGKALKSYIK